MQGPKDFTTNHTDMLLLSLNPLGRLEGPASPSSRGNWAVVGRQFSASDPVESEPMSLSPWASYFTPKPQLPHPQMGRIDPKGNCHWEWVMKPFLPPSLCLLALRLAAGAGRSCGVLNSVPPTCPPPTRLGLVSIPTASRLTVCCHASCSPGFLEVQSLPPSLWSALG